MNYGQSMIENILRGVIYSKYKDLSTRKELREHVFNKIDSNKYN